MGILYPSGLLWVFWIFPHIVRLEKWVSWHRLKCGCPGIVLAPRKVGVLALSKVWVSRHRPRSWHRGVPWHRRHRPKSGCPGIVLGIVLASSFVEKWVSWHRPSRVCSLRRANQEGPPNSGPSELGGRSGQGSILIAGFCKNTLFWISLPLMVVLRTITFLRVWDLTHS